MAGGDSENVRPKIGFGEAMMAEGEDRRRKLEEAAADLQQQMESAGEKLRALVLAQPPTSLLGYLWSQFFLGALQHREKAGDNAGPDSDLLKRFQFVLEYIHAVWSAHSG